MKKQKSKVLVAMSGGVDSSVAALLLKKQGYEVIGAFMKNWSNTKDDFGQCTWRSERHIAQKIAAMLDIPLITLDFEKEYKKQVIADMFKSYKQGITPNPDVVCNQKIKFPLLWKAAKKLGCRFIATGHYARIKRSINGKAVNDETIIISIKLNKSNVSSQTLNKGGRRVVGNLDKYELLRARDESKDQSYFLYRLTQNDLLHTLFPIGNYTKTKTRQIAKKHKFPNWDKKSTVGICFIGKVNLKKFLQQKIKPKKGKIISPDGKIIGEHDGIYYYTIGQRIGPRFGIEVKKSKFDNPKQLKRWYVARKDLKTNTIIAAPQGHQLLLRKSIIIKQFHVISDNKDSFIKKISKKPLKLHSRIRHVGELLPSTLTRNKKTKQTTITLKKPITGISEGQAIVLYQGKKVFGGGVIRFEV